MSLLKILFNGVNEFYNAIAKHHPVYLIGDHVKITLMSITYTAKVTGYSPRNKSFTCQIILKDGSLNDIEYNCLAENTTLIPRTINPKVSIQQMPVRA